MQKYLILIISLLLFFLSGEIFTRMISRHLVVFDLEMLKYSLELKDYTNKHLSGFTHKPNKKAHLMGVPIEIDSFGFRETLPSDQTLLKKKKMILLGDSLTFGWGVKSEETFASLLQNSYGTKNSINILNAGHCNYNTQQELSLFKNVLIKLKPEHLILFYFINDAELTPKTTEIKRHSNSFLLTLLWSRYKMLTNQQDYKSYYRSLYDAKHKGWKETIAAFRNLKNITQLQSIHFSVILLPDFHNFTPYPFSAEHDLVGRELQKLHINFYDMKDDFSHIKNSQELWVAQDDSHPNSIAHKIIAKKLEVFLKETHGKEKFEN